VDAASALLAILHPHDWQADFALADLAQEGVFVEAAEIILCDPLYGYDRRLILRRQDIRRLHDPLRDYIHLERRLVRRDLAKARREGGSPSKLAHDDQAVAAAITQWHPEPKDENVR
jgi:hypothetical protein